MIPSRKDYYLGPECLTELRNSSPRKITRLAKREATMPAEKEGLPVGLAGPPDTGFHH